MSTEHTLSCVLYTHRPLYWTKVCNHCYCNFLFFHALCWEGGLSGCHRPHNRFKPLRQPAHRRPRQRVQVSDEPSTRPHQELDLSHVISSLKMDVSNRSDQALSPRDVLRLSCYMKPSRHEQLCNRMFMQSKLHTGANLLDWRTKRKSQKRLRPLNVPVP